MASGNVQTFNPVIGPPSSMSASAGSTAFYDLFEVSPRSSSASSASPASWESPQPFNYQPFQSQQPQRSVTSEAVKEDPDLFNVCQAMTNLLQLSMLREQTEMNEQAMRNIAALAKLDQTGGFAFEQQHHGFEDNSTQLALASGSQQAVAAPPRGCQQMQIRCKFGQLGAAKGQFNAPHGFCHGKNEEIIVADTNNHRIQVFDKNGNFSYTFGNAGKEEGYLWYPRKVAVMRHSGHFVICDRGGERSRMQIFTAHGQFVRRIQIRFIDIVAGLAISREGHIVAVDSVTPTIFVINEMGKLVRYHECSEFMTEPSDIAVCGSEYYVCDFKGHCVVVVSEDGRFLRKIGSDPVTTFPNGIDISDAGDVLIGDSHGNQFHVAVYDRDGQLVSQFQCPHVKVSRCCGLKITSEGYVVTLAKNNHHVLVLNTLYVT